jgi:hypothetical protein
MLEPSTAKERIAVSWLAAIGLLLLTCLFPSRSAASSEDPYILLWGGSSTVMDASAADIKWAKALHDAAGGDLVWFRHAGKSYVIRDAATLKAVRELFAPQEALGRRQGDLGARQGELGRRQGELGRRQGELGKEQWDLEHQGKLTATDLADKKAEFQQQQDELEGQQDELNTQQEELGAQQETLAAEQERLSLETEQKFRTLLAKALADGIAQEVRR